MPSDDGYGVPRNSPAGVPADASAQQLADLAASRPDLWNQIWDHPNSYDGLREWMSAQYQAQQVAQPASPLGQQAPKKRGRAVPIIASVAAAALVLAGGGTALALTGTLDRWFGGSSTPTNADTAALEQEPATFTDGIAVKWTLTSDDLGSKASLLGHLPRMMGPINQAERADQPIQLQAGVLMPYRSDNYGGDVPASWVLLDNETGHSIWNEEGLGYPNSCTTDATHTQAFCNTSFIGGSELIGIDASGIRFNVDTEYGALHAEQDRLVLQGKNDATEYSFDGKELNSQWHDGVSAGAVSNAESLDCVWVHAAETVQYLGSGCGEERVLTASTNFNWSVIDRQSPKILVDEFGTVTLFDAASGEQLWSVLGQLPGWYEDPQIVQRSSGDAVLLQRALGNTFGYALLDLETGAETVLPGASGKDWVPVVAGNEILLFEGDPPVGNPITGVRVFDPETGEQTAQHALEPISGVAEITGGPNGVLFGYPHCTDCTTAEGSHVIDSYTFLGPGESGASGDSAIQIVLDEAPGFVPGCPGDTVLLAWMELEDGWIVVCGYDALTPTYVAYQPGGEGKPRFSLGASQPDGEKARSSVKWDPNTSRYVATMADGSQLTLDYKIGTATLRDGTTHTAVNEQLRFIRYVFVSMGTSVRGIDDAAAESGAFNVKAPESTAEDQIRYMIEVLEKAYEGRAMLKDALPKLAGCTAGPGGYADTVAAMKAVRDNRAELLQALDAMPVDKIPEGKQLLADLTEAITLSHQANGEYVAWAEAANANGCATLSAAGKNAADASDAPKERFATRWNKVIAPKYGVRSFDGWYI